MGLEKSLATAGVEEFTRKYIVLRNNPIESSYLLDFFYLNPLPSHLKVSEFSRKKKNSWSPQTVDFSWPCLWPWTSAGHVCDNRPQFVISVSALKKWVNLNSVVKRNPFFIQFIHVCWAFSTHNNIIFTPLGVIYSGRPRHGLNIINWMFK